ncbi:hypothetical protein [Burkholderia pyrrocinia]
MCIDERRADARRFFVRGLFGVACVLIHLGKQNATCQIQCRPFMLTSAASSHDGGLHGGVSFSEHRYKAVGGDVSCQPCLIECCRGRPNVSANIKRMREPVFAVGASYQITRRFCITGMVTSIPMRTKITFDISQPNRTLASNTLDISTNPVLARRFSSN